MNKFFKSKQTPPQQADPVAPVPRALDEINKVYSELCGRAGQLQYGIKNYKEQLEQINAGLKNVIAEGDARTKLNQEETAKQALTEKEVKHE